MTNDEIERLFTYVPATDAQIAAYKAVGAAEKVAMQEVWDARRLVSPTEDAHKAAGLSGPVDLSELFGKVNRACVQFIQAIVDNCPPSADTSAAIRCVRLARMMVNDDMCFAAGRPAYGDYFSFQHGASHEALQELRLARYQANAAIALATPAPAPVEVEPTIEPLT